MLTLDEETKIKKLLRLNAIQGEINAKANIAESDTETQDLHAQLRVKQQAYSDSIAPLLNERKQILIELGAL